MRSFKHLANRFLVSMCVVLAGVTSAVAAGDDSRDEPADIEQLKRDWEIAIDSLAEYSADQRDAAIDKAGETLAQIDEQIDVLEEQTIAEWEDLSVEAREARIEAMRELQRKRNDLAEWYGGLKHSSVQAWGEVKEGFADAYRSLEEAWQDAADEIEE